MIDWVQAGLYVAMAVAMLGSPGPAVVALLSISRAGGFRAGFMTYLGLDITLVISAALTLAGVYAIIFTVPFIKPVLVALSLAYLLYLAWKIANAPVGTLSSADGKRPGGFWAGVFLAVFNPKVYVSFTAVFSTFTLSPDPFTDAAAKWILISIVIFVVDILWVLAGTFLGKIDMPAHVERRVNWLMALVLLLSVTFAYFVS